MFWLLAEFQELFLLLGYSLHVTKLLVGSKYYPHLKWSLAGNLRVKFIINKGKYYFTQRRIKLSNSSQDMLAKNTNV